MTSESTVHTPCLDTPPPQRLPAPAHGDDHSSAQIGSEFTMPVQVDIQEIQVAAPDPLLRLSTETNVSSMRRQTDHATTEEPKQQGARKSPSKRTFNTSPRRPSGAPQKRLSTSPKRTPSPTVPAQQPAATSASQTVSRAARNTLQQGYQEALGTLFAKRSSEDLARDKAQPKLSGTFRTLKGNRVKIEESGGHNILVSGFGCDWSGVIVGEEVVILGFNATGVLQSNGDIKFCDGGYWRAESDGRSTNLDDTSTRVPIDPQRLSGGARCQDIVPRQGSGESPARKRDEAAPREDHGIELSAPDAESVDVAARSQTSLPSTGGLDAAMAWGRPIDRTEQVGESLARKRDETAPAEVSAPDVESVDVAPRAKDSLSSTGGLGAAMAWRRAAEGKEQGGAEAQPSPAAQAPPPVLSHAPRVPKSPNDEPLNLVATAATSRGIKAALPGVPNQDAQLLFASGAGDGKLLAAVLDGHGHDGHGSSERARQVLEQWAPRLLSLPPSELPGEFRCAFEYIQETLEVEELGLMCGTTLSLAIVDAVAGVVSTAHVGDSTILLASASGEVIWRSTDHKCDEECARRVDALGGEVRSLEFSGINARRVFARGETWPGLAMARALGDVEAMQLGVLSEPEISEVQIAAGDTLVVASDGVWEKFAIEDVAQHLTKSLCRTSDPAHVVVSEALNLWPPDGDVDDITAIVIRVQSPAGSAVPVPAGSIAPVPAG